MKPYHCIILAVMVWTCMCTFSVSLCQTETTTFGIDNYIPEYFHDFEWRIIGGAHVSGSDHEQERTSPLPSVHDNLMLFASDQQAVDAGSFLRYRYETVPRFFTFSMASDIRYSHINSLHSNLENVPDQHTDFERTDEGNDSYDFRLSPGFDVGQYLAGDMFLSSLLNIDMQLRGTLGASDDIYDRNANTIGVDSFAVIVNELSNENTFDDKMYRVNIRIMPGWGRVYEGNYAATAMYMVDELRREKLLNREPTATDMRELCELIYYYRLTHPVDTRLLKIEALQTITEFFINRDMISDPGPYGYLLIQDVWDFFPRTGRPFGLRFRLGPGIDYSFTRNRGSQSETSNRLEYISTPTGDDTTFTGSSSRVRYLAGDREQRGTYVEFIAEYHKPIDLRWQLDAMATGRYYPDAYRVLENDRIYYMWGPPVLSSHENQFTTYEAYHTVDATAGLRYIFNSRTSSRISVLYVRDHFNSAVHPHYISETGGMDQIDPPRRDDRESDNLTFSGDLTYRISIPTTLNIRARYYIGKYESEQVSLAEDDRHGYSLSATFTHYLY